MLNKNEINLMNDAMFKALFRSKEARGVIASILSIVLDIDKEKLIYAEYNARELVKDKLFEKGKTCDIIVKIDDGNKIILEMNQFYNDNIFNKNTTYSFSVINESIKKVGKKYIYPNVILINIDAFNKFKTEKGILDFRIRDAYGHIETNLYRSIHLVLENLVNKEYNEDIRKFATFLKEKSIEKLREDFKGEEEYMAYIRKVEDLSTNPEFIGYYDVEESHAQDIADSYDTGYNKGYDTGEESGITKGIVQGHKEKSIEIAKNLLKQNLSIENISLATGLTTHEIENLK